ncbi:MAG: pyridoxamine 5-phosphate oxidase [Rhodospirillaceae bacterium]|jgi:predicted pyridoxine 5'-phosphate oxidase superfamily flavin-nucleotide-binding protein|uniref:pyridoxamine 5'-phosphate oxidase family protein n=1 Tax=Hwanghaeella sp. 1Z406 TaxID=3402811 RepID=UPI000C48286C|nr:pyridoxamine 5-phosphate oxidase [Rhodospirillaceae bacterium]|tara:strand:+ start:890 stop:1486 length:597 start_codon:yes stop_codon:yes gene_type:complete
MSDHYAKLTFTPAVQAEQVRHGSRSAYANRGTRESEPDVFDADATAFIQARDSFYMASVSETGWPYVQHRGGPVGFLKVLSPTTMGFADFRGNRQYISAGNLKQDDRVSLILVDYPSRARLKIMGHARVTDDPEILTSLSMPDYKAKVEQAFLIDLAALEWNCPQHITPRFTNAEIQQAVAPLHMRIAELEAELARRG